MIYPLTALLYIASLELFILKDNSQLQSCCLPSSVPDILGCSMSAVQAKVMSAVDEQQSHGFILCLSEMNPYIMIQESRQSNSSMTEEFSYRQIEPTDFHEVVCSVVHCSTDTETIMPQKLVGCMSACNGLKYNEQTFEKLLAHFVDFKIEKVIDTLKELKSKQTVKKKGKRLSKTDTAKALCYLTGEKNWRPAQYPILCMQKEEQSFSWTCN